MKNSFLYIIFILVMTIGQLFAIDPGLSAWEKEKYPEALEYYKQKLIEEPDNPVINYNAGVAAQKSGLAEEAESFYQRALRSQDPELLNKSYYNMGQLKLKAQDAKAALEDFQKSIAFNSKDIDAKAMYEMTRKILEEQKQQQQQDQQNQDQQDQQENQEQEQQKQDQEQDKQNQEEEKDSKDEQQKQDEQSSEQQEPKKMNASETDENMDEQQVENILNAMRERELESMKKLIKEKHKSAKIKRKKDW